MTATIGELVRAMETIAPPALAEAWDNVGLLVGDPSRPLSGGVLLTIDMTGAVVQEAIAQRVGAIIAYHPPIFAPLKRLSGDDPVATRLLRLIEARVAVYSPHTALDAAAGGVTDWLLGLVSGQRLHDAIIPSVGSASYKVVVFTPPGEAAERVRAAMSAAGAGHIGAYSDCSFAAPGEGTFLGSPSTAPAVGKPGHLERVAEARLEMACPAGALAEVIGAMRSAHPYEEPAFDIVKLEPARDKSCGQGRVTTLQAPARPSELASRLKNALRVSPVLLASRGDEPVTTIAAVPGSGGALLDAAVDAGASVFITGEMKHHEILAALDRGCAVILAGHTQTERGYLPTLAQRLGEVLKGVEVRVSVADGPPMRVV